MPIILSSDKTMVSVTTGQNDYWPIYISIGNLHNNVWWGHCNGVALLGFLANPKSKSFAIHSFCHTADCFFYSQPPRSTQTVYSSKNSTTNLSIHCWQKFSHHSRLLWESLRSLSFLMVISVRLSIALGHISLTTPSRSWILIAADLRM